VTLKGQMVPVALPAAAGGGEQRGLLYLASPRCSNLHDMQSQHLFLSDIPLHDMSRDFILLAEQRQAEADLKEKFERLTVEMKAANEKLARTTRWLEEEKARADALLYRMSGLISCFPAAGGAAGGAAADAEQGGGGGGAGCSGPQSNASGSLWAGGSEDGQPLDSMAAVAALLRQAGVRPPAAVAPSMAGDSIMMGPGSGQSDESGATANPTRHLHTMGEWGLGWLEVLVGLSERCARMQTTRLLCLVLVQHPPP